MRLYHGTRLGSWPSIEATGLVPHRAWSGHGVFATDDVEQAAAYAAGWNRRDPNSDVGVVLTFEAPAHLVEVRPHTWLITETVPPAGIEVVRLVYPGDVPSPMVDGFAGVDVLAEVMATTVAAVDSARSALAGLAHLLADA